MFNKQPEVKTMSLAHYNKVTQTATACLDSWSNRDKVRFHVHNPNGIMARRHASDDRIRALVDSGFAMPGALYAHGTLNDYHTGKLFECAQKARVIDHEATYYVQEIEREIAAANAFIDSIAACI
jgi:hypothetical protein